MKKLLLSILMAVVTLTGLSQTDTVFWFAAPEIMNWTFRGNTMDRPINFNITSYSQPVTVTISQPAGGGMPTQVRTLAANSTVSVDLTEWIENIECKPGNKVLNNGLKIASTAKVSIYYETNANGFDPDLFSLKGRNALGTDFWISSQFFLDNSTGTYSSFNIVATEDNTVVNIKPSNNIVGHAANSSFSIVLNKGQTYAAIATSEAASKHLQGSHVTSNKPVAITLCDDELSGAPYGGCGDMAGDQTVPVDVIGNEYIAVQGSLKSPYDKLYILAVQDGTRVNQDGVYVKTLQAGETLQLSINNASTYIQSDKQVYAYQLSGIGCEVGSAILPKVTCTGSSDISFQRTSTAELFVTILVKNGGQANFLVNGAPGIISPNHFTAVPGTSNSWYAAKIPFSHPAGAKVRVTNTTSLFHLGLLQGGEDSGTGYGYFSDFAQINAEAKSNDTVFCSGGTLQLFTDTITSVAYNWTGPNGLNISKPTAIVNNLSNANAGSYVLTATLPGCAPTKDSLRISVKSRPFATINTSICEGQSFLGHTAAGTYIDTLTAVSGCDSIRTLNLTVKTKSFSTINTSICEGQSFLGHTAAGTYIDTLTAASGCDSIRTLNLSVKTKSFSTINTSICEGQSFLGYTAAGTYIDTLSAANGCDSIRTLNLTVKTKSFSTINTSICEGQNFLGHTAAGTYIDTLSAANGCDSIRTLNLTVKTKSFSTINTSICEGQNFLGHAAAGTYIDTLTAASGCDSIRTLNLTVKTKSFSTINTSICEGQNFLGHTAAGTYIDTLSAASGCDSIRTLNLTVKTKSFSTINTSICEGQSFLGHTAAGTYIDTLTADSGCDSIRTLNLTVKIKSFSTINTSICEGQSFLGHTAAGTYIDTLTAANGCDSIRTLNLSVNPSFVKKDTAICEGSKIWAGGAYQTKAGTYYDSATVNDCRVVTATNVTVYPLPKPYLGADVKICEGDPVTLSPGNFQTYLWQNGATGSSISVSAAGTYWVKVTNEKNCATNDTIQVLKDSCPDITIPNAFSPNNDGINDTWIIRGLNRYNDCTVEIFNRYGRSMFKSTGYAKPWNGEWNGQSVPFGTYYYLVEIPKLQKRLSGWVLVVR